MSAVASQEEAQRFVEKWSASDLSERAASHEHFIDLCHLVGQPAPAEADPTGQDYCFEKAVKVVAAASKGSKGEGGFVDVWNAATSPGSTNARTNTIISTRPTASSTSTATRWTTRRCRSSAISPPSKSAPTFRPPATSTSST